MSLQPAKIALPAAQSRAGEISHKARERFQIIDRLDVEHHWPAGVHVDWQTGVPDGRPEYTPGRHTHCSAFVASAAELLGIYILRPPEHGQVLLANAQFDWLGTKGRESGWQPVAGGIQPQSPANQGYFVLPTYKNQMADKPGHIAIVRPGTKSAELILQEGPDVTQAGSVNYRSVSLKTGFSGHPRAFNENQVRYYAHK